MHPPWCNVPSNILSFIKHFYLWSVSRTGGDVLSPLAPPERLQLREKVPEDNQILRVRRQGVASVGAAEQEPTEPQPVHLGQAHIQL
jgi:hypothetical protein